MLSKSENTNTKGKSNSKEYHDWDDDENDPIPLNFGRLLKKIKMDPHIELIPPAFIDSVRGLLIWISPNILGNTTTWLLLMNLELLFGYWIANKMKVFSVNTLNSSAVLLIAGMSLMLCLITQLKGFLVVGLAILSIISQIMHANIFEGKQKQKKDYSTKIVIRDIKLELMFYRCAMSFIIYLFSFVISELFNSISHHRSKQVTYSLSGKIFTIVAIGFVASGSNIVVTRKMNEMFHVFFYKILFSIADFFIKIALLTTTASLYSIAWNSFLIIGYCLLYLEEIAGNKLGGKSRENRVFIEGNNLDEDDYISNLDENLDENILIDFIRVIWKK